MNASLTLSGDKALAAQLRRIGKAATGPNLVRPLQAGALLIVNQWKINSPVDTGTYRNSQHVSGEEAGADYAEVAVGSNVEYGPRLELGFVGTDSLGRTYHQAARPSLRSALESTRGEVEREIAESVRALLRAAL